MTPARHWALGLMIVASAGALLATSDPHDEALYNFKSSSDGPRATLSASVPQARYLLRARVTALGPEQVDSTESALAKVHGSISSNANGTTDGGTGDSGTTNGGTTNGGTTNGGTTNGGTTNGASPFVRVTFGTSAQASDSVSALTSFQVSQPLHFTGNCAQPGQDSPCQAEIELDLDLERPGALPAGGSLSVDWSVDFESRAFKPDHGGSNDETIAAPWTVEIVELTEP